MRLSHLQGIGLAGVTPTLPYESSEKIGRIEFLDSRDLENSLNDVNGDL